MNENQISDAKDAIRWAIENGAQVEKDFYGNSKRYFVREGNGEIFYLTGELFSFANRVSEEVGG